MTKPWRRPWTERLVRNANCITADEVKAFCDATDHDPRGEFDLVAFTSWLGLKLTPTAKLRSTTAIRHYRKELG